MNAVGLIILLIAYSQASTRTYQISAADSSLWCSVGKTGCLSARGHEHEIRVKAFTGRVVVPSSGAGGGSLEFEIETKSFVVLDKEVGEKDRGKIFENMHKEVIESEKYQKIIFKSVSVADLKKTGEGSYNFILNGDLTLHGMTKRIALPVTATIAAEQLRATGNYTLKQSDYGITAPSGGAGTVKVKNEVVVNFNIVAKAL